VADASLWENLALREFGARWARRAGLVEPAVHVRRAERLLERFGVRGTSASAPARSLSGGNQQRLLLARELAADPRVLVLVNPTRGLDVAATRALHEELLRLRVEGRAILLLSTELDEVLSLADRCAVMRGGELREAERPDPERIGRMMVTASAW
jgi:simple sugar transport system ATP-binding protein